MCVARWIQLEEEEGGLWVNQIARLLADLQIVTGEAVKESGGRFKQAWLHPVLLAHLGMPNLGWFNSGTR